MSTIVTAVYLVETIQPTSNKSPNRKMNSVMFVTEANSWEINNHKILVYYNINSSQSVLINKY